MDEQLDNAPCGFLSFADDGSIQAINRTLLDHLGYARDEVIGANVEMLLTLASRIFYQTHFFPLIKLHGKAEEIFITLRPKTGQEVPMLSNAVRVERGGVSLNNCAFIPVHHRRKYEDEILQAKKAAEDALQNNEELIRTKRELEQHALLLDVQLSRSITKNQELARLTTLLSHELKEPIRKVSMFADVVEHDNKGTMPDESIEYLEKIKSSCVRMDTLLSTLRQFVSVDVAEDALSLINLNEVVRDALKKVLQEGASFDLKIVADELPTIQGHHRQLVLLFQQLFDNAAKFRKLDEKPVVSVTATILQHNSFRSLPDKYRYVDFARIVVKDNGIGFDTKYKAYVFDLMKQVGSTAEGVGLGLPMCRKIAENHGGSISVESVPGLGTTFSILLPVSHDSSDRIEGS